MVLCSSIGREADVFKQKGFEFKLHRELTHYFQFALSFNVREYNHNELWYKKK